MSEGVLQLKYSKKSTRVKKNQNENTIFSRFYFADLAAPQLSAYLLLSSSGVRVRTFVLAFADLAAPQLSEYLLLSSSGVRVRTFVLVKQA